MGIYLNPGNENFKMMISGDIYVDKTMMISAINRYIDKGNKYVCVSRPRRFGKTMAGNMLSAYYSKGCESRDLFSGLKISGEPGFLDKLNKYNVIKLDMNSEYQNTYDKERLIRNITDEIKAEMAEQFPDVPIRADDTLARSILRVHAKTGETFIMIMDEYDVLVREKAPEKLFDEYLSFLNGLFKSDTLRPAISLAYLTGILPVVRDKVQSKLNNFYEYTMIDAEELAEFIGFTSDEVIELCNEHKLDYEECKLWYDGYYQRGIEIYNPESVVKCTNKKSFAGYWGMTSSYEVISEKLKENYNGIKDVVVNMLSGESVSVDPGMYLNTVDGFYRRDEALSYLIHLGYLAFDIDSRTCFIPNKEVRMEWERAISILPEYSVTNRIIKESMGLLSDTLNGDCEAVARALDESHVHVTSNRSYNNEDALQSAIYLAYIYALNEYTVIREMTSGKGFADVVYIPVHKGRPAMIIELKRNSSPESAIDQIRRKNYHDSLKHYQGELLFVGINYDEKEKSHECRIERFVKE